MARKNVAKVFDLWLAGKAGKGDSKGTIHTDGVTIWSYRMPICVKVGNLRAFLLAHAFAPSMTTKTQRSTISYLLRHHQFVVTELAERKLALAMDNPGNAEEILIEEECAMLLAERKAG